METRRQITRIIRRSPILQAGILLSCWAAGEALVRLFGVPLPGGVVGLAIALALLATRRLSAISMKRGADWFLADMLLFFVPAVLAVIDHREFLGLLGLKVLFVIVASTASVMIATALAVDCCDRWRSRHADAASDPR